MMDESKYELCDNMYVGHPHHNGKPIVVVSERAVQPIHTVQRMVVVEPAPSHAQRLVTLRVQAATPADASKEADRVKYEHEERLGHFQRRQGKKDACC